MNKLLIALPILLTIVLLYPIQAFGYASEEVPCFTYFEQVSDEKYESKCITWNKTKLTYHITNEIDPSYSDYYRWAFASWQYYTGGLITFAEVKGSYNADIEVKLLSELRLCPGALGCTELQHGEGQFLKAYIYGSNRECQFGEKISSCIDIPDRKIWLAALHETGHSIGLAHVQDNLIEPIDIMYYKVEAGNTIVSDDDIQKIGQMYGKPDKVTVEMKNAPYNMFEDAVQFVSDIITIKQGETVTWVNNDDTNQDHGKHTVTSGTPRCTGECWGLDFDSGIINPNESYSLVFDEVGEYPYLCSLHPWMIGKITVVSLNT